MTHNDTLNVQNSTNVSITIQSSGTGKSGQEVNSMNVEHNSTTDKSYSTIKENSIKKHKSPNIKKRRKNLQEDNIALLNNSISEEVIYSKYNVCQKSEKHEMLSAKQNYINQEISDSSSDSEISICEVPIPPKPKPLLIDLQDSDEENAKSADIDNFHQKELKITNTRITLKGINSELEGKETLSNQVIFPKNKNISKSSHSKNKVNIDETITQQTTTHTQEVGEDIVLNCLPAQRITNSMSEMNQNQRDTLVENIKHKKRTPQKKTKYDESNDNLPLQDTYIISSKRKLQTKTTRQNVNTTDTECNVHDLGDKQDFLENMLIPYRDQHEALGVKRKYNSPITNKVNTSKHKRQCTIQQSQNVMLQDSNDKEKEEGDKYFYDTRPSQELRDCNSTCNQENFDVGRLQSNMSKDPKMWTILDEDLMPRPTVRQRNRFWNIRCSNCHQDGHQRSDCTVTRRTLTCYMCGKKGHTESRCSLKICLTCGKQQNTFRKTCEYCRVLYCTMCNSLGHKQNKCPDLWRRYHQTTDMSNVPQDLDNTIKPPNLLHCCNCTKRGHESSTCKAYRWSQHFITPATVTNYTAGPVYEPDAVILSDCDRDMIISPLKATSETLIPQNVSMQQAPEEHSGLSANVNSSPPNEENDKMPIFQEAKDTPQMEEIIKTYRVYANHETKQLTYIKKEKTFTDVIFCCGKFPQKNNKSTRIICQNLSTLAKSLPIYGKSTVTSLEKRQVLPNFLNVIHDKQVHFEVKIGFTTCQRKNVMLQLIAVKQQLEVLYELLLHWLNLPIEEKDYGMDITLPKNSVKMFNILENRMPQFKKMGFTSYDDNSKNPQDIYAQIKFQKARLKQAKDLTKKKYHRQRTILGRLLIKLLMIVNTEPEPNKYVHTLQNAMKQLELTRNQNEELDTVTYLKFIHLYNVLFVPHTPIGMQRMLYRFEKHMKKQKLSNTQQKQQEFEDETNEQENHSLCTDMNLSLSPITPSTSQDINFVENPSAIDIQQNDVSNNITNEEEITNNILPINNAINNDCDETMTNNFAAQIPPFVTSANTESVIVISENLESNVNESFTSDIDIDSVAWMSEQSVQFTMPQKQTISKEEKFKKLKTNLNIKTPSKRNNNKVCKKAVELIKEAYLFRSPHLINAADELQRKMNNEMLLKKHILILKKLIELEKKHQKEVISYCNSLK